LRCYTTIDAVDAVPGVDSDIGQPRVSETHARDAVLRFAYAKIRRGARKLGSHSHGFADGKGLRVDEQVYAGLCGSIILNRGHGVANVVSGQ
jgi:hypothetical protein